MTQSTQSFTQSLRLLDPVNQKRIKFQQRILWPDYETLNLLNTFYEHSQNTETQMNLSNLFMYCPYEENFTVIKTNKEEYLNLKELYSDQYTHLAFWVCKQGIHSHRDKLASTFTQNIQSVDNRRQKSLQKIYRTKQKVLKPQQIYVILCKRPIAIDQIIKTPHKVCIAVAPLSGQKFLWGGVLHYEEIQSLQHEKKEQSSLFKTGGQSFGFKIEAKPSFVPNSYRKSNGLIDKRQQRYSNYFKAQKEEPKQINVQKVRKQCSNKIKILPQHIRQHQQLLYIQMELSNNSQLPERIDQYQFVSIDIYARHLRPRYGGVYENQSQQSSNQNDQFNQLKGAVNKYKKLLRQEIFLVYSMPFMQFNSYLQSQLNYEESQQLRQINFRGSCLMFSAMKKLQIRSNKNSQQKQKQINDKLKQPFKNPFQMHKKQRYVETEDKSKIHFTKDQQKIKVDTNINYAQQKQKLLQTVNKSNNQNKEIIRIYPQAQQSLHKQQTKLGKRQKIKNYKRQIINKLCKGLKQKQNHVNNGQQQELIYFPVFNPDGFEPLRIGIDRYLMTFLNPLINKLITKVFVQNDRIIKKVYQQAGDMNRKRLSVYMGIKRGDKPIQKQKDLVGIDVFLTDKVYKQQTVYTLINTLKQLQELQRSNNNLINQTHEYEQIFGNIISIEQFKNFCILIDDIRGQSSKQQLEGGIKMTNNCELIRELLWTQMIQRMNKHTQWQLRMIRQVQTLTHQLVQQTQQASRVSINNKDIFRQRHLYKQLQQKQHLIIDKIKQYHYYYSTDDKQITFFINLFFYFFTSQNNNYYQSQNDQNKQIHDLSFVQQVFNEFFFMNCKLMVENYSLHLSSLIDRLQQQSTNNQLLSLCQLLKTFISYAVDNLYTIPINIFLSQPLQQIQQYAQQHQLINQLQQKQLEEKVKQEQIHDNKFFGYKRLRNFLKKYFIKGHNFLDRHGNQSLIDGDNVHINITTDLLNLFIKVSNIQKTIQQNNINHKNEDDLNFNQHHHKPISNVIQLVQQQYSQCLVSNNRIEFSKLSKNGKQQAHQQQVVHNRFKRNSFQIQQTQRLIQRKQKQILQSNPNNQWIENNLSYLINWNQNKLIEKQNKQTTQQQPKSIITITNNTLNQQPIQLSHFRQYNFGQYNFNLNIQQQTNINNSQPLSSSISFYPNTINKHPSTSQSSSLDNNSYSIDMVKTHLGINYHNNNNKNFINNDNKSLFDCFQVFVSVQITTNLQKKSSNIQDVNKIIFKGSNLLVFENFNTNQINKNNIQLHPYRCQEKQTHNIKQQCQLSNIHQVSIKIYSRKLPILSASLSFINLRLGKYLKNLLKKSTQYNSRKSTLHATNRKTIGDRYTQHLNNRKSVLSIEQNLFFGQTSSKSKNNAQISTLYDLPENLLFDLLRVDKSYIQDQEKILHFIDEFYQKNQPQYEDYVLYLCVRPNFIRLSTILKHYFANKLKYDDSKILSSIIRNKLSPFAVNRSNENISQLIIKKPRISSYKPLKNIIDTNEQRQLLNKYMKDLTRKNSLSKNQHSQSLGKSNLFSKKIIFQVKQQRKENPKEFQI